MRPVAAFVFLVPVLAVLAGCELYLELSLVNNTGHPIMVLSDTAPLSIVAGQTGQIRYPDNLEAWTFRISDGQCEYRYQVPERLEHWPWPVDYKTGPSVQVEGDFSIWGVPPNPGNIADVSSLAAQQKDGFPLHPVSRTCR